MGDVLKVLAIFFVKVWRYSDFGSERLCEFLLLEVLIITENEHRILKKLKMDSCWWSISSINIDHHINGSLSLIFKICHNC